ncbi:Pyridoxamine 5'-phosphate oxidase [Lunatimonas lonarensis]|uniref:Pyridoxine/pyridoxamine 5'-phosphate oxidase n=1 Tax=Lunatimonas lonarensis TaxID=1232681 RepID=R7ZUW3_9BACT|nr:pyridoxamine 5'-phosphate oxidase [Lunatimonas lonarensis]EON77935.1 Pyridoxamine 5'-phosphate oxidase [Lunatimonas lonarensis]
MKIADIRKEYSSKILEINKVEKSPLEQFKRWMEEALSAKVMEPNAMNLATIGLDGRPTSRIVLLKGIDHGFVFFTNYTSKKGRELTENSFASLNFFWPEMERQVRIEGKTERVSEQESDEYFLSRPLESQIGAWTSPQSQEIPDRLYLEEKRKSYEEKFSREALHRPAHWGGFRLIADRLEFWQGRPGRLHDRIKYELEANAWKIVRLAP